MSDIDVTAEHANNLSALFSNPMTDDLIFHPHLDLYFSRSLRALHFASVDLVTNERKTAQINLQFVKSNK
jgi:hypothetical protein